MRFRGTLVAILVFAGLLSFIYFYEYKGEEAREAAERAAETPISFEREKVVGIAIDRPGKDRLALARDGKGWKVTSPLTTRGDAEKIDALLSGLGWLKIERRLDAPSAEELASFGLKEPAATVSLTLEGAEAGAPALGVKVGEVSGIGQNRYLQVEGSADALLVSGSLEGVLNADPDALRFRKVVGVNSWDLTRFSLQAPGGSPLTLEKEGESWSIVDPAGGRFPADTTKVNTLWSEVQAVEADGFGPAQPTAEELQRLGLAGASLTLTVEAREQEGSLRVEFGRSAQKVHARRSDMETLLKVRPDLLDKLEKAAGASDDLRDARVAPVDRWRLKELSIERAGTKFSLFKDEESRWRWGAPDGREIDSESVNPLLDSIEELRAVRYLPADATIGPGDLTVSLREGEGETARTVTVWVTPRSDGPDRARLVSSSVTKTLYAVAPQAVQTLVDRASALKEPAEAASAATPQSPSQESPAGGNPAP